MATTTGTIVLYQSWLDYLCEAANMSSDTVTCGLTTSTYTPAASTHALLSDITNEVSGNGYARDDLASISSSQTSGTYTYDNENAVFTADSGSIVARYWFLFDNTVTNDPLMFYGLLDDTPADVTTTDTNTLTVTWNASGIFTIS